MSYKRTAFTVDDALSSIGFGKYHFRLLAYAGLGWVSEGMEMMLLSFLGPAVKNLWKLSDDQESSLSSVVFAGMMVGCWSWGNVSDRYGRRKGFFVTAVVLFLAGLATAFSPNYVTLLILRCLVGVGLGGSPVLSSWFLEFVPISTRGFWMVVFSSFWGIGSVLEASLAWLVMPRLGWRWLLGLSAVPSAVLLIFYMIMPESPRYLCLKGRNTEAVAILEKIAKSSGTQLPPGELVAEHNAPSNNSHRAYTHNHHSNAPTTTTQANASFFTLFSPKLLRITLLLWVVFWGNAFLYYGVVLFTTGIISDKKSCDAGSNSSSSEIDYKSALITSFAEFPGLIISAFVIDRIGRKMWIALLLFLCCIFLFPLIFDIPGSIATALLFGVRACLSTSFSVLYIFAPEVYPTNVRSRGFGMGSGMARAGGLVTPYIAVAMINACRIILALAIFVSVSFLSGVSMLFFPFDTKGRNLADITDSSDPGSSSEQEAEAASRHDGVTIV